MSQSENIKSMAAEARIEETRSFVRTVKGATRCMYPTEEKIRIVYVSYWKASASEAGINLFGQGDI